MYQFFVESGQIGKDSVMIEGSDVNHIKNVLRMKPGEKIRISGPAGENYFCEIAEIEDSFVRASILEKDETGTELPKTLVGKVAYRELEDEEEARLNRKEERAGRE